MCLIRRIPIQSTVDLKDSNFEASHNQQVVTFLRKTIMFFNHMSARV